MELNRLMVIFQMRTFLSYATPLFAILIMALIIAGCTAPAPTNPPQESCGFTTCHGLDLACSPDAPEVCDLSYRLGDKCRQYARCDSSGGTCTLVTDPEFAPCKACVEECEKYSDPQAAFACEEKC